MHALPPPPPGLRSLTDPEADRLRQQYPDLWANPNKTCLTCNKVGSFKARILGEVVDVACDCVTQWKMHRWMLNAGIGLHYQRLSWDDATGVATDVQMVVMDYVANSHANLASGNGLTLWSPDMGTGKTLLATLLVKELLARGHDAFYVQFNEMLDFFTATWRDADERAWFTRKVRNAGVLGVDDMGRENKGRSEMAEAMFDTVIRARGAADRPTIITTNYDPAQMKSGYGANIHSLLSESNVNIEVSGRDFRPDVRAKVLRDEKDGILTYPILVG